jgi:hypothetical protein
MDNHNWFPAVSFSAHSVVQHHALEIHDSNDYNRDSLVAFDNSDIIPTSVTVTAGYDNLFQNSFGI